VPDSKDAAPEDSLFARIAHAFVGHPFVYDLVQALAGQSLIARRLRRALSELPHERVFDVGSATASFSRRLGIEPVSLDLDVGALAAARRRRRVTRTVGGDASQIPFPARAFDVALCVAMSHHLDDDTLHATVAEIARVTAGHLLFLDALKDDSRTLSRWMWRYDRGSHPRTRDELLAAIAEGFSVRRIEEFSLYHRYILCVATPHSSLGSRSGATKSSGP
jgi:ubiquinone/menaquinone biosynthesis C-methylase UbiE